jgi:PAS domain S-box-containing protein
MKGKAKTRARSRGSSQVTRELADAQEKIRTQQRLIRTLRKSEEQFRSLLDDLPVGLYRRTAGEEGRFITANQTIAKLLGYDSLKEFVGLKAADLYVDTVDVRKFWQRILAEGQVTGVELRLKKRDGTPIWGAFTARLVRNAQGEAEYLDGVMEDITERKQAEQELRESDYLVGESSESLADARHFLLAFIDKFETEYLFPISLSGNVVET